MGTAALIFGLIGGLCAIMGVVTVVGVMPPLGDAYTWHFWFGISVILLLMCIAFALGRGGGYE